MDVGTESKGENRIVVGVKVKLRITMVMPKRNSGWDGTKRGIGRASLPVGISLEAVEFLGSRLDSLGSTFVTSLNTVRNGDGFPWEAVGIPS